MSGSAARQQVGARPVEALPLSARGAAVFWAGAAGIALLLLQYYRLLWQSYIRFNQSMDVGRETFMDFARYYRPMGEAIFRTAQPVDGFVYSPFIAILLGAFAPLRLSTAIVVWGVLQAVFVILYIAAFRRLVGGSLRIQLLFVLLLLSSFPLLHTIRWGQVTLFSTVALLGALIFMQRRWLPAGAGLLAFAASFKFVPLIFVAPFAARRDLRLWLWIGLAIIIVLVGAPVAFLGVGGTLNFYRALWVAYGGYGWAAESYNSQYFPHVMIRLAKMSGADQQLLWLARATGNQAGMWLIALRALALCVAACNVALVWQIQRAKLQNADLWSFAVLFMTIPFLLGTSWPVDLVFLPFVQTLLAAALFDRDRTAPIMPAVATSPMPVLARGRKAAAALLLVASIVCANVVLFSRFKDYTVYGGVGFVFWSDFLLLIAAYLLIFPALRKNAGSASLPAAIPA